MNVFKWESRCFTIFLALISWWMPTWLWYKMRAQRLLSILWSVAWVRKFRIHLSSHDQIAHILTVLNWVYLVTGISSVYLRSESEILWHFRVWFFFFKLDVLHDNLLDFWVFGLRLKYLGYAWILIRLGRLFSWLQFMKHLLLNVLSIRFGKPLEMNDFVNLLQTHSVTFHEISPRKQ